jgi:hypothetical protein
MLPQLLLLLLLLGAFSLDPAARLLGPDVAGAELLLGHVKVNEVGLLAATAAAAAAVEAAAVEAATAVAAG